MEEERWEEKSASFTKTVSNLYIEIKYCGDHSACPPKKNTSCVQKYYGHN